MASGNHKNLADIPLSVLDLAPISVGETPADAFRNSLDLAQHVDQWGFNRYWLAEHHNTASVASSATSVLISYIAGRTTNIRVGSGGIMLPNHAPLMIAEQFGTLESLYPGRIDLGLGRAPGTDYVTSRALRRDKNGGHSFPELLKELRSYFGSSQGNDVRAIPGEGMNIPIWLLGSSDFSARLSGELGLPFAFAGQFSPDFILPALDLYRRSFQPSEVLDKPYTMVGINVVAADTDEEAERLATSLYQSFLHLVRRNPMPIQPPVDNMDKLWNRYEKDAVARSLSSAIIGSAETVQRKLQALLDASQADELIITTTMYAHEDRMHSYEIIKSIWR